jgi:hypothetical protein
MQLITSYKGFFDRSNLRKKIDAATRRALSKAGSFIRTRARSSIKRRKKSSKRGEPPSAHTGLIKKILFAYEPSNKSVVVGFEKLNAKPAGQTGTSKTVPELLEFGGSGKLWRTGKAATWEAFPTMGPALQAEAPNFPDLFSNSL